MSIIADEDGRLSRRVDVEQDQHALGAKADQDKVDLTLVTEYFPRALEAVARTAAFGAKKYTRGGWRFVPYGVERYTRAMLRHIIRTGPRFYEEEGEQLDHDAQVAWNALARLELILMVAG